MDYLMCTEVTFLSLLRDYLHVHLQVLLTEVQVRVILKDRTVPLQSDNQLNRPLMCAVRYNLELPLMYP